jgi:hypothetical protein
MNQPLNDGSKCPLLSSPGWLPAPVHVGTVAVSGVRVSSVSVSSCVSVTERSEEGQGNGGVTSPLTLTRHSVCLSLQSPARESSLVRDGADEMLGGRGRGTGQQSQDERSEHGTG